LKVRGIRREARARSPQPVEPGAARRDRRTTPATPSKEREPRRMPRPAVSMAAARRGTNCSNVGKNACENVPMRTKPTAHRQLQTTGEARTKLSRQSPISGASLSLLYRQGKISRPENRRGHVGGPSSAPLKLSDYTRFTFSACSPLGPCLTSNSTSEPSSRLR
jgi:hypothetical protein